MVLIMKKGIKKNYQKNGIKLENKDCLKFLKTIKNESVDLVLIDPPYQISQNVHYHCGGNPKFHTVNYNFGEWDYNFTVMKQVIQECYRVLKQGGTIVCFYDLWKLSELKEYMEESKFRQLRFIEWVKRNPVPTNCSKNYLTTAREIAVTAVKGTCPTFNSRYDKGIYEYGICQGKDRFHTTQKPVELIADLVRKHSNEGELVLDCFSGSGSTAMACIKENRCFVGCELDKDYYIKSVARIDAVLSADVVKAVA